MSTDEQDAWRRIVRSVDVADDLQAHISVLTVDGEDFVEIRNWIVSTESYGRGILLPIKVTRQLRDGLSELLKETR